MRFEKSRPSWRISFLFPVAFGVLVISGCAGGVNDLLCDVERQRETDFAKQTLQWVDEATRVPTAKAVENAAGLNEIRTALVPQDKFLQLAAGFFGLTESEFQRRSAHLSGEAGTRQVFANGIDSEALALAVAWRNPAVKAARHRWKATLNQYSQAEFLDALISEYRTFTRYLDVVPGKPLNKSMTKAFYPWPGVIGLKGDLVAHQVRLAEFEWQKALRDEVVAAGRLYFEYQYLQRAEAVARENVALAEDLIDVVGQRYRTGKAAQMDLLKAQTERERQANRLRDFQARQVAVAAEINALISQPVDAPLGRAAGDGFSPQVEDEAKLTKMALLHRQEVALQRERVERLKTAIRLGEVMNRPVASQGYSAFERGMKPEASEGESGVIYGAMRKTKVQPAYAQAEAYLAEMRDKLAAEQARLAQAEADTRALVRSALQRLDIARRQVDLVVDVVVPQSRSAHEIAVGAYAGGHIGFLDLLDAQRTLLSSRLEIHAARRELNLARLDLALVRGKTR